MMEDFSQITPTYLHSAIFPVIFYDGEESIDLGTMVITPAMNFHIFRSFLSKRIGISHHQFTIYFEQRSKLGGGNLPGERKYYFSPHPQPHHHRHPVTNKFNFASAMLDSPTHLFRVVLKRSRRTRRRSKKTHPCPNHLPSGGAAPLVLLRRDQNYEQQQFDQDWYERERYLMSLNLNSDVYNDLYNYGNNNGNNNDYYNMYGFGGSDDGASASSSSGGGSSERGLCEVCLNANVGGDIVSFHWCKNDAVTTAFRSPAGPIGPPRNGYVRRFY